MSYAACRWRRDNWEIKLMEQPDEHYSLVGGNLVISNPRQKKHAGTYVCVAKNIYGTVISKEARVKFGCEHLKPAAVATSSCFPPFSPCVFLVSLFILYINDPHLPCSSGGVF